MYQSLTFQRTLSVILLYIATFWTGWSIIDYSNEQSVIKAILAVSAIVLLGGILLIPFKDVVWQSDGRFRGLLINPNSIGLYTAVFSPLFFWRWMTYRKAFDLLLVITIVVSVVLSGSRNGFLAFLISSPFLLNAKWSTSKFILIIVTIGFVITLVGVNLSGTDIRLPFNINRLIDANEIGDGSGRFSFGS